MRCENLITNNRGNKGERQGERMAACESSRQKVFKPSLSKTTNRYGVLNELSYRMNQKP